MIRNHSKEFIALAARTPPFHNAIISRVYQQLCCQQIHSSEKRHKVINKGNQRLFTTSAVSKNNAPFGLRPPEKQPWSENDERWDTPQSSELAIGEKPKGKAEGKRSDPGSSLINDSGPIGRNALRESTSLDLFNLSPLIKTKDLYQICEKYGSVVDVSFSGEDRSRCKIEFETIEQAVSAKEALLQETIFLGEPITAFSRLRLFKYASKYLEIQSFRGTVEELRQHLVSIPEAAPQIVFTKAPSGQLRVDAVVKFQTVKDAITGKKILTLGDLSSNSPQFIDPGHYFSLVTSSESSRSNLTSAPSPESSREGEKPRDSPRERSTKPSGPSKTIFMGQIPIELLQDTKDIYQRFGKYGPLKEVRIPKTGMKGPRGFMYLEYHRQEDADALYNDLQLNPLFLFGRRVTVDYAETVPKSKFQIADATLFIGGINPSLLEDPWTLWETFCEFSPPIDIRILRTQSGPSIYIDFESPDHATKVLNTIRSGALQELGPGLTVNRVLVGQTPKPEDLDLPPTDTLRLWNLPSRAILDRRLLREAFRDSKHLIDIRIPLLSGWPRGLAFLQFAQVESAQETLAWIRSDPENPITFFGRPLYAEFAVGSTGSTFTPAPLGSGQDKTTQLHENRNKA